MSQTGREPQALEYASPPARRRRMHPVPAAILAHLAASYASSLGILTIEAVRHPGFSGVQAMAVFAKLFLLSPIRVPLLPATILWLSLARGPEVALLMGWLAAYVVLLFATYWWFRRPTRGRRRS